MSDSIEEIRFDEPVRPDQQSMELDQLATALSKAQGEIKDALKDSENPHFKSNYATLSAIWEACRTALSSNGLSVIQRGKVTPSAYIMRTRLLHQSGQWIEGEVPCITGGRQQQNEMQQIGSAITYARRYGLAAIVGVAPEGDDDAENMSARKPAEKWHGPLNKTDLKKQMRQFAAELTHCTDESEIDGLEESYRAVIDQARKEEEMRAWVFGDDDQQGALEAVGNKRREVKQVQALQDQTLLDAG